MYSEGNLLSTDTLASFWDTLWQELWPLMCLIAESHRIEIWQARHVQKAEILQLRPTGSAIRPFHIFSIPLFRMLHRRPTGSLPLKGIDAWPHRTGCKTQIIVGRRCALPPWGPNSFQPMLNSAFCTQKQKYQNLGILVSWEWLRTF